MGSWTRRGALATAIAVLVLPTATLGATEHVFPPGEQVGGNLAFDGANYLVVWNQTGDELDVYGARVAPDGTVLDPGGIPIATGTGTQAGPRVAFDGTNYLVTWRDTRTGAANEEVYAARVTTSGTVLDPDGIQVSAEPADLQEPGDVAFDGTNFLIAWWRFELSGPFEIYAARVSPDGVVLDADGIPLESGSAMWPVVSFDGTNYLVAWTRRGGVGDDIYGARVSPAGTVLDPSGLPIAATPNEQRRPAIGFDGSNYFVTWNEIRDFQHFREDVYGSRVTPGGTVLDPQGIEVVARSGDQAVGDVESDGDHSLVVWADHRFDASFDVYGGRVADDGSVLDLGGIPISTQAGD
jgi:hypothetical protein